MCANGLTCSRYASGCTGMNRLGFRPREEKRGAVAGLRLGPDSASALLDNSPDDGETDADTIELILVEPLEDPEDPLRISRVDADPVIADGEFPRPVPEGCRDVNHGLGIAAEFDRVADQSGKGIDELV